EDLCVGLGRMRVGEVEDSLTRAIVAYLSAAHAPQCRVRVPKELVSDVPVIVQPLAAVATLRYSQDADDAWFTKGDGAWISGPVIIAMRDKGYLLREPWDGESRFDGNDTISDKGRSALTGSDTQ